MAAEQLSPSAPETRDTIISDGFLGELFDRTQRMIEVERSGSVVAEFGPQRIPRWYPYSDLVHKTDYLPIQLEKGLILRSERYDYGLGIGKRHSRGHYEDLSVEFGLLPNRNHPEDLSVNRLRMILTQYDITFGSGRIYYSSWLDKIQTDCWTDHSNFGGPGLGRWEEGRALSEEGLVASVDLFRQIAKRAWG